MFCLFSLDPAEGGREAASATEEALWSHLWVSLGVSPTSLLIIWESAQFFTTMDPIFQQIYTNIFISENCAISAE